MASGKKNYFRHSFFARNDLKLRMLRDRVGVGFYFYFFSLLEQCGELSSDKLQEEYEFHDSIIRSLWCINLKKSERVANELHAVGLLLFEKRQKTFWFSIPNFAKYLGKYTNKTETNTLNKRKGNKIKEKKRKEKETPVTFDFIDATLNAWIEVVTNRTKNNWLREYERNVLQDKIERAYEWASSREDPPRSVGGLVATFLKDIPKKSEVAELEKKLQRFHDED